jgi:DNA-binding NarL/FixJ family response regulator
MRVLLVDDHPLIQEAVGNVLKRLDTGVQVHVASDCQSGLRLAADVEPDLLLLDLHLPGVSGIAALKMWRTRFPAVPVIVLSATNDRQTVLAALEAGAAGFIPKSSSNEVMLHAVRLVQDGGKYVPPEALPHLGCPRSMQPERLDEFSPEGLSLTGRQMDVLRLIARGAPNKVICRELGLAERTVKTHITAIFRALHVTSRTQAAIAAAKLGIPEVGQVR